MKCHGLWICSRNNTVLSTPAVLGIITRLGCINLLLFTIHMQFFQPKGKLNGDVIIILLFICHKSLVVSLTSAVPYSVLCCQSSFRYNKSLRK